MGQAKVKVEMVGLLEVLVVIVLMVVVGRLCSSIWWSTCTAGKKSPAQWSRPS